MNRKRKKLIAGNEISEIRTYLLDGIPQKVLVEGKKKTNPLVLFLHGGPGSPLPFCAGGRGMFPELTSRVTMVYWDQLGCGINDYLIDNSFAINRFVVMTIDLIKQLKAEFQECGIHLFGVSWGSILAAKAAHIAPELLDRVAIYGQVLHPFLADDEVFLALEQSKMPDRHRDQLTMLKEQKEYSVNDLIAVLKWIRKYTEGYQSKQGGSMALGGIVWGYLTSPDYSLKNVKALVINGYRHNQSLFKELLHIELAEILKEVQIPYLILQGDSDIVTSTKAVAAFVEHAGNENLQYQLIEHSGHMASANAMSVIIESAFGFFEQAKKIAA